MDEEWLNNNTIDMVDGPGMAYNSYKPPFEMFKPEPALSNAMAVMQAVIQENASPLNAAKFFKSKEDTA